MASPLSNYQVRILYRSESGVWVRGPVATMRAVSEVDAAAEGAWQAGLGIGDRIEVARGGRWVMWVVAEDVDGTEIVRRYDVDSGPERPLDNPDPGELWIAEALADSDTGALTDWLQRVHADPPFGLRPWPRPTAGELPTALLHRIAATLKSRQEARGRFTDPERRRYRQVLLALRLKSFAREANPRDDARKLYELLGAEWSGVAVHRVLHEIDRALAESPAAYVGVLRGGEAVIAAGPTAAAAWRGLWADGIRPGEREGARTFLLRRPVGAEAPLSSGRAPNPVRGPVILCHPACQNARGHRCECRCGGAYHGRS